MSVGRIFSIRPKHILAYLLTFKYSEGLIEIARISWAVEIIPVVAMKTVILWCSEMQFWMFWTVTPRAFVYCNNVSIFCLDVIIPFG
jgi:hypothetical protein